MASFDEVVPPGQAGTIKASVHTSNFKGAIGKSITVTHDDPSQGPIAISLIAKIIGSVDVLPFPALQLGRRPRGFDTPAKLLIRKDPTEQGTMAIGDLASTESWLKISQRTVTAKEPAVEGLPEATPGDIIVSVLADGAPVGSSVASISFTTGLTREPKITIPVTVFVQPLLTFQPNNLILSPSEAAPEGASGQVLAALRDDVDPKTVSIASDTPSFVPRIEPPGERAFRVIVDWIGKGKNPPTETTIHVRVGKETVNLPVKVNLSRPVKAS